MSIEADLEKLYWVVSAKAAKSTGSDREKLLSTAVVMLDAKEKLRIQAAQIEDLKELIRRYESDE